MYRQIEAIRSDIEHCANRESLREILPPGGSRNVIDCALWDLESQRRGTDIWSLTGIDYEPVQTVMTIPIRESAEKMGDVARRLAAYPILKVKLDGNDAVERLTAIRKARPDAETIVDANQGFTLDLLKDLLPDIEQLGITIIEQPLPRGANEGRELTFVTRDKHTVVIGGGLTG